MSFSLPADLHLDDPAFKRLVDAVVAEIEQRNKPPQEPPSSPTPPFYKDVIIPSRAEELMNIIDHGDTGVTIRIDKSLRIRRPLDVKASDIEILVDPGAQLLFSGFVPFSGDWKQENSEDGNLWVTPYKGYPGLKTHPATNEGPWDGHRDRMRPEQVHIAGKMLRQVYERKDMEPGTFYVDGPSESPEALFVMLAGGGPPENVFLSAYPRMCYTSTAARNVRLVGVDFEGAANTGKVGMVERGDFWDIIGGSAKFAASVGYKLSGEGGSTVDTVAESNGQLGYLVMGHRDATLSRIRSFKNNRKGFDAAQEAGGCKIIGCDNLTWGVEGSSDDYAIWSQDDNGPGHWFDIWNKRQRVYGAQIFSPMAAGQMLEHGFSDGIVKGTRVFDVREYIVPVHGWSRRDGLVMQSHVWENLVEDYFVSGAYKGVVYKWQERRGPSGGNTFRNFVFENIQNLQFYRETMTQAQIMESIRRGEKPATFSEWFNADTYDNVGVTF